MPIPFGEFSISYIHIDIRRFQVLTRIDDDESITFYEKWESNTGNRFYMKPKKISQCFKLLTPDLCMYVINCQLIWSVWIVLMIRSCVDSTFLYVIYFFSNFIGASYKHSSRKTVTRPPLGTCFSPLLILSRFEFATGQHQPIAIWAVCLGILYPYVIMFIFNAL